MIHQAFKFALDLTPAQQRVAKSHTGASRFAYNHLFALVKGAINQREAEKTYGIADGDLTPYVNTSHYSLRKTWNQRKDVAAPWWSENSKECYSDGAKRLSLAMGNFFDSRSGKRKGRAAGFPRVKRRSNNGSVKFTTGAIRVENDRHHVTLPTIGRLKTYESTRKLSRRIDNGTARILSATLSHSGSKCFVSFTVEVERAVAPVRNTGNVIGVDVGLKSLYIGANTDGEHIFTVANPQHTKHSELLLRTAQRNLSRKRGPDSRTKQTASNRWLKAQKRVRRIHTETANRRIDLIHKTTTSLAKNFDVVVVENPNIAGMMSNHRLAKSIADASWGEFFRQLQYKTLWYGSTLIEADKWFPSSKMCSGCEAVKAKLSLSERMYECSVCSMVIDRDVNAAVNLARLGITSHTESASVSGRGGKHKSNRDSSRNAATVETSISPPLVA